MQVIMITNSIANANENQYHQRYLVESRAWCAYYEHGEQDENVQQMQRIKDVGFVFSG